MRDDFAEDRAQKRGARATEVVVFLISIQENEAFDDCDTKNMVNLSVPGCNCYSKTDQECSIERQVMPRSQERAIRWEWIRNPMVLECPPSLCTGLLLELRRSDESDAY